jgi:hypothetical protein
MSCVPRFPEKKWIALWKVRVLILFVFCQSSMQMSKCMGQWRTQFFFSGVSTNSVDRGQREQISGGGSPLVRGSAQFANGWTPYSY